MKIALNLSSMDQLIMDTLPAKKGTFQIKSKIESKIESIMNAAEAKFPSYRSPLGNWVARAQIARYANLSLSGEQKRVLGSHSTLVHA